MKLIWQGLEHRLETFPRDWKRHDHDEPNAETAHEKIESGFYVAAPEQPAPPTLEPADEAESVPDHEHPGPVNPEVQAMQDAFNTTPAAAALGTVQAAPETPAP